METVKEAVLKKSAKRLGENEPDYLYNYMTYGAYRVIYVWLNKERRETPHELAVILAKILMD